MYTHKKQLKQPTIKLKNRRISMYRYKNSQEQPALEIIFKKLYKHRIIINKLKITEEAFLALKELYFKEFV